MELTVSEVVRSDPMGFVKIYKQHGRPLDTYTQAL